MWLNDLLPHNAERRPTRPTSKNHVGRPQTLMPVGPSNTSDTSDLKTYNVKPSEPPARIIGKPFTKASYQKFCPQYWQGCGVCPYYMKEQRRFCALYNDTVAGVLQ